MSAANFRNIAVIGAGTMGSGIAAQIANAGHNVLLLDLGAKSAGEKTPAESAIDRLLASDPPQLMSKKNVARITTGVIDDDLTSWPIATGSSRPLLNGWISKKRSITVLMR